MVRVPDAGSLAAMRAGSAVLGRRVGGSTGTNLWGAFGIIAAMRAGGRTGSVVTLICDGGERYADTYYSDVWVAEQGLDLAPHLDLIGHFLATGDWPAS
jgi:cysteine synthase A